MDSPIKRFARPNAFLLPAAGRRSGQPRAAPLSFYPNGTRYRALASNRGKDVPPAWLLNLKKQPAVAGEQKRLWKRLTEHNQQVLSNQSHTVRLVSVVVLTPLAA